MATQWFSINHIWWCLVETPAIGPKTMSGSWISTRVRSNGRSMSSKTRYVPPRESTTVLQSAKRVQLRAWWLFLVEGRKPKRIKIVHKEIRMDARWMTSGDWENTEMVVGIGSPRQNHNPTRLQADTSTWLPSWAVTWSFSEEDPTSLRKLLIPLKSMTLKVLNGQRSVALVDTDTPSHFTIRHNCTFMAGLSHNSHLNPCKRWLWLISSK